MSRYLSVCLSVLLLTASALASAHPGHGAENLAHEPDRLLATLIVAGAATTIAMVWTLSAAFAKRRLAFRQR